MLGNGYVHREMVQLDRIVNQLFNESLDAIIFWNHHHFVVNANEAACKLFECSLEELKTYPIDEFIYEKDERYQAALKELKEKGTTRGELLFQMYNGQLKYVEFTCKLHTAEGYHMTILRNVTERYQMEKELRDNELKFRKVFEGSLDGMILWDEDQRIVDLNRVAENSFHVPKSELIGAKFYDVLSYYRISEEAFNDEINRIVIDGVSTGTVTLISPSGKKLYFEYSTKHNVFSQLSLTTFRNITEKLELEERLHKSDTLTVIGQLAAGIAHEIRNPMTALKGFIQLLEDSMTSRNAMYFQVISTELNRIDTIINEFLILAKPQSIAFERRSLVDIMQETVHLLSAHALLYNIQFDLYFEENLPEIVCEVNQLKKVFINIIKNGIEVMEQGGVITISVRQTANEHLQIAIKDQGPGIPKEKLRHLGEPFYTTKDRGTGLGLMVSYRVIEEHGGYIVVDSKENLGTTFHIHLPIKEEVTR